MRTCGRQQVNGNFRNVHTAFDFSNATVNLVDESVTVTDSMGGTLGTVNAADGPKTFTYTKTIGPYAAAECGQKTVDNTATFLDERLRLRPARLTLMSTSP